MARQQESHGMWKSTEYKSWAALKDRAGNVNNPRYMRYGGRGITVCDGIKDSFLHFYSIIGKKPFGYSVDRVDNNKGYWCGSCADCEYKERSMNIRWASSSQQAANRTTGKVSNTGHLGVSYHTKEKRYKSYCSVQHKTIYLGSFIDLEDAIIARKNAEEKYYKEKIS